MKQTTRTFIVVAAVITMLSLMKMSNANANPNAFYLSCEGTATEVIVGKKEVYKVRTTYYVDSSRAHSSMSNGLSTNWSSSMVRVNEQEIRLLAEDHFHLINRVNGDWKVERRYIGDLKINGTCRRAERAF